VTATAVAVVAAVVAAAAAEAEAASATAAKLGQTSRRNEGGSGRPRLSDSA
jgi:hypothetical protein